MTTLLKFITTWITTKNSVVDFKSYEEIFARAIGQVASLEDPAHDLLHFQRVVKMAKHLGELEKARMEVVVPAAWLHDLVNVPKNDPRRSMASRLSAQAAEKLLNDVHYPKEFISDICHAIEAHSFSANITARTIEAKVVQDADRLDGLGAIGLARCFATAGIMKRSFYSKFDPFCNERTPNDLEFTVDHFFVKLFKTVDTLQTSAGRQEGQRRAQIMRQYLSDLKIEI
ncbi:MAG: HD domain-containing protein [Bacteriovoracaceae bacterium]|nr:HD domain-containing protein [Bacteriovoracaceae bacterium]